MERANHKKACVDFAALPSLALSAVLDKLDKEDQAACAAVCHDWLHVVRSGCRKVRIVVRPPEGVDTEALRNHLGRFPELTALRIAGLAAADDVLPSLPPLPQLRALDLESCGLRSQPPSSWLLFEKLTSLSYTERNCDLFTGKELLGLPLLQDLSITCLSGEVQGLLSRMPEMPALKGFSLSFTGSVARLRAAVSYPWMRNLERLSLRFVTGPERSYFADELPNAILGSCDSVEHLSLCMEACRTSSILKVAGLKRLRTFRVHADSYDWCPQVAQAAWRELKGRLTAICVTEDCGSQSFIRTVYGPPLAFRRLPRGLESLRLLDSFSEYVGAIDAASLTRLVGLKQLSIDIATLAPFEPLTALRGLTKLQIRFTTRMTVAKQEERAGVLGVLPQLRELVLDLWLVSDGQPNFEAALLRGISQSGTKVNLGVHVAPSRVLFFPTSFVAGLGERLVDLRICCVSSLHGPNRGGKPLPVHGASKLPCHLDHLWRLQLRFDCPLQFLEWLGPVTSEKFCSMAQLRFVCLLFDAEGSEVEGFEVEGVDLLEAAVCSAFPTAVEVCIHWGSKSKLLSLCASCSANRMDDYEWCSTYYG